MKKNEDIFSTATMNLCSDVTPSRQFYMTRSELTTLFVDWLLCLFSAGFWDHSESDSELELSRTGGTITHKGGDQDDDFDFDFYD